MLDIILGGKCNALALARALAIKEIDSYLVDNIAQPIAANSKYIKKFFYYDNDIDNLIKLMSDAFGDSKKILYPTSDYWLEFIVINKKKLEVNGFLFFDNNSDIIDSLINKLLFYQNFSSKFLIPETADFCGSIQGEYIVKPQKSFQQGVCINKGFSQYKKNTIPHDYLIKQALVDVDLEHHYSISGIAYQGEIKTVIVTRKELEYPHPGGTATMISTVKDRTDYKELVQIAESFLGLIHYSGAFEVEVLKEQERFWLLEVNARFWLQHIMPLTEGINFAIIYRRLLMEEEIGGATSLYYFNDKKNLLWLHEAAIVSFIKASFPKKWSVIKIIFSRLTSISFGYYFKGDIKPLLEFIKCRLLNRT